MEWVDGMEEAEEVLEFVEAMEGVCFGRERRVRVVGGGVSVLPGEVLCHWEGLGCGWDWP